MFAYCSELRVLTFKAVPQLIRRYGTLRCVAVQPFVCGVREFRHAASLIGKQACPGLNQARDYYYRTGDRAFSQAR